MTGTALRRVLLVGFMGAGKTSVGQALARALGWRFADFDEVIEERELMSVGEIFRTRGEAAFREVEEAVASRLLGEEEVVLGSGGGWAATPGRLRRVPAGTATFWLQVSPGSAIERVRAEPGRRPLLDVRDPLEEASSLLSRRVGAYGDAHWAVDTEGRTVEDVSARILAILAREFDYRD